MTTAVGGALVRRLRTPAARVGVAVALNQLAPVLPIPLVARFFAVGAIAQFQLAFSISIVLQVLVTLGLEYVIPGVRAGEEARRLHLRAMTVSIVAPVVLAGAAWALAAPLDSSVLVAVAWGLVMAGAYGVVATDNAVLIREGGSVLLARRNLLGAAAMLLAQLGGVLLLPSEPLQMAWLCASIAVGRLVGLLPPRPSSAWSTTGDDGEPVRRRGGAVLWIAGVLLSTLSLQLPVFFAAALFTPAISAAIAFAIRIASAPASLVGGGLAQAFTYASASRIQSGTGGLADFVDSTQRSLMKLSLLVGAVLAVFGLLGVGPLLGEQWRVAGILVTILALPYAAQVVNRVTTPLFAQMRDVRALFWLQVVRTAAMLMVVGGVVLFGIENAFVFCAAIAVVSVVFQLAMGRVTLARARAWEVARG